MGNYLASDFWAAARMVLFMNPETFRGPAAWWTRSNSSLVTRSASVRSSTFSFGSRFRAALFSAFGLAAFWVGVAAFFVGTFAARVLERSLKMNARPENRDEDQRDDTSGGDPGIASFQLGWFC